MGRLRGVPLDLDGTLVDNNDAHAHTWVEALAENGIQMPFVKVRRRIGVGGDKLLPTVAAIRADSSEEERISPRRQEIFQNGVPSGVTWSLPWPSGHGKQPWLGCWRGTYTDPDSARFVRLLRKHRGSLFTIR